MKYFILIPFLFMTCFQEHTIKPKLLNTSFILRPYKDAIHFRLPYKSWKIEVYGSVQPIPFVISHIDDLVTIVPKYSLSIPTSFLHVVLSTGNNFYVFRFQYQNHLQTVSNRKYRSPKSINTDSVLLQYSLEHTISTNRNIIYRPINDSYFEEKALMIDPLAGTFTEDVNDPRSSYYVQPGSPAEITLTYSYDSTNGFYRILTNSLVDLFGNKVANGTSINYYVKNRKYYKIYEQITIDGVSSIIFQNHDVDSVQIMATIGILKSNILYIK